MAATRVELKQQLEKALNLAEKYKLRCLAAEEELTYVRCKLERAEGWLQNAEYALEAARRPTVPPWTIDDLFQEEN